MATDSRYSPDAPRLSYPPKRAELRDHALFHICHAHPEWPESDKTAFAEDYADVYAGSGSPAHALDFIHDWLS